MPRSLASACSSNTAFTGSHSLIDTCSHSTGDLASSCESTSGIEFERYFVSGCACLQRLEIVTTASTLVRTPASPRPRCQRNTETCHGSRRVFRKSKPVCRGALLSASVLQSFAEASVLQSFALSQCATELCFSVQGNCTVSKNHCTTIYCPTRSNARNNTAPYKVQQ